jgi:phenylacetate-CoA ligase
MQPAFAGSDRAGVARELQHRIKTLIGVSTRVDVLSPDGIERSAGKARRVIDNRPK